MAVTDSKGAGVSAPDIFAGGGELGALMRAMEWSGMPVGPPQTWPQSLKTVIRIMLTSRYAMWMGWGAELSFFYNDAYRPTLGTKHPWALGPSAREVWKEIWPAIGPRIDNVIQRGEATYDEGLLLFLERHGYPEETYHTFSYSPLPDDLGNVGGMLCVVTEETDRVIGERRLRVLRELAADMAGTHAPEQVYAAIEHCFGANQHDLPFCLVYLFEEDGARAKLASCCGVQREHLAAPAVITADQLAPVWPVQEVFQSLKPVIVDRLPASESLPKGPWDKMATQALILPIAQQGQMRPAGVFIAGLNPYRHLDEQYSGFIDLVVGQIAAGLANAHAYEEEHRRAEALAEIDRAKTTFFSNASHEFRTPLTLMLSPLEDMLVRNPTAETMLADRHEVELIHRNGLRLLKLVNSLLDFSRIEAGRIQAVYELVDLAAYTGELASSFRSAMERAGLRYAVACEIPGTAVYVDRDMWEKIVLNLISNAFKYTLEGEVSVGLRPSSDGRQVELTVGDTGIGVPDADMPRLFERFHRVEGQRGRSQEGTGIGLALVQELARLHGGAVQVRSTLGQGTEFTVSIPIGKAHLPADRIGAAAPVLASSLRPQAFVEEALRWLPDDAALEAGVVLDKELAGQDLAIPPTVERPRVILADDNADMRGYVNRLLAARYEVEAVGDGMAALEAARRQRPALVLSDVMMPRLDGFGLLAALRADDDLHDIPVILLSARAGEEAKVEGLEAGADDYLTKPFSARELLARVSGNLELARVRRLAAQELRRLNETLEERVAEEINERMKVEEAFRQAQKMEAIGQLTGGVAHDFNNLLQVILGNLDALHRRVGDRETPSTDLRRLAESAIRGAERAAILTQRLLAFSRRQPLEPKSVDVNKLVTGMSDLLRRTLGESIAVEAVLAGGLWRAYADPNQLESALLNLAVNARDAMPRGGKLTLETANTYLDESYASTHEEVIPGQYVGIAVSDTGSGMTRDVVAKAFDPFFTTKDVGQGTGLGLSQVYGFVKQTGGHVKIYSEPGEGTVVRLYLPRRTGQDSEVGEAAEALRLPTGSKNEIVLVVEDDEEVRASTVDMLRELGYSVLEAAEGRTALQIVENRPDIHLLFTDVGLPGGFNGRHLADQVRRLRPELRILFTTGYARNAIVHEGRLDPGIELIVKPFTFAALAAKVRHVLSSSEK